jgi:hypothetical protein
MSVERRFGNFQPASGGEAQFFILAGKTVSFRYLRAA